MPKKSGTWMVIAIIVIGILIALIAKHYRVFDTDGVPSAAASS